MKISLIFLLPATLLSETPADLDFALTARTDRADALYQVGETASFAIEATQHGKPLQKGSVVCVLSKDGVQQQPAQKLELQDGRATITGTLADPGFLQLRVTLNTTTTIAAAGYDPLKIKPSLPIPEDFDAFWAAQKAALAAVPMKIIQQPVKAPRPGMEAFDVQVDCVGVPVSGYFGRPLKARPKSLPAILYLHGSRVEGARLESTGWATLHGGMLAFDINGHGIPNGKPAAYYEELSAGTLKDYRYAGRGNRDECYFKHMFLRLIRAIDFLAGQPEWDGKTLIVFGASMGGFQGIAAAGLDERVSFLCAGMPAGCDHTGVVVGRVNGWPKLVPTGADLKPDAAVLQTSRYFDCVNFASRAKCRGAAFNVGFVDVTCPPTGVYAAYNVLNMPKAMFTEVLSSHVGSAEATLFRQKAVMQHIQEMQAAAK